MNKKEKSIQIEIEIHEAECFIKKAKKRLLDLKASPKLYKGQQVLARDTLEHQWVQGILVNYNAGAEFQFKIHLKDTIHFTRYCKPDPKAVTLPVWIEHDGSAESPVDSEAFVVVVSNTGFRAGRPSKVLAWKNIVRYSVVPDYEGL